MLKSIFICVIVIILAITWSNVPRDSSEEIERTFTLIICGGIVALFIIRKMIFYHQKLDDIVELLKDISLKLDHLNDSETGSKRPKHWECPKCKKLNPGTVIQCYHCNYKPVNPMA